MKRTVAWLSEAYLPAKVDVALKHSGHFLMSWMNRRVPVTFWRGPMRPSGRPATVLVGGDEPWANSLPARLFSRTPQRETLGGVPFWKLPRLLQRQRSFADLTIARVDRWSARLLFDAQYLAIPEWIGMSVALPLHPRVLRSHTIKNDIRKMRHHRLSPMVSHREGDFDAFYPHAYLPFLSNRHAELAFIHDRRLLQRWFRQGGIIWTQQVDGQRVGGLLFSVKNGTFHSQVMGIAGGELQWVRQGALSALYLYSFEHARHLNCRRVDLGGTRPFLQDGALRYKANWGATIYDRHNTQFDLLVYWERFTPAVEDFLSQTTPIFRDNDGLSALHAIDTGITATRANARDVHHRLWTDGLQRLYLISASGWTGDGPWPPRTVPLVPDGKNPCTPGFLTQLHRFQPTLC